VLLSKPNGNNTEEEIVDDVPWWVVKGDEWWVIFRY
jgi:hypothetical protein